MATIAGKIEERCYDTRSYCMLYETTREEKNLTTAASTDEDGYEILHSTTIAK